MSDVTTARSHVDRLIGMYAQYKQVLARQAACQRELAKAKLRKEDTVDLQLAYDEVTAQLQSISDEMTYASPTIWLLYKYEAYADEAQPIRTVHDFRVHCSKPGYICTKRFQFVNAALSARGVAPLSDANTYADDQTLDSLVHVLAELESDDAFMESWRMHEYHKDGERVAKWERL